MHKTHEQVWDIFLMTSRDGFHWDWIDRRVPFLGRGDRGLYGAYSGAHSFRKHRLGDMYTLSIALATLPEDRWVGLLAGPYQGTILTRPFTFSGSKLMLDIDASLPMELPKSYRNFDECEVQAALLDRSGGAIEGFTLENSTPLLESGRQEMRWKGKDLSELEGKPVQLRLATRASALYSIQFERDDR